MIYVTAFEISEERNRKAVYDDLGKLGYIHFFNDDRGNKVYMPENVVLRQIKDEEKVNVEEENKRIQSSINTTLGGFDDVKRIYVFFCDGYAGIDFNIQKNNL